MNDTETDSRTFGALIRQYREIEAIKGRLIREGLLDQTATSSDVENALRKLVPADAFRQRST
jgi:hypothetical protein